MPTTNYICTHGMVWGEISDSGVMKSYGHDALGSVTETFVNGALENTYRYKPYGSLLAKTGSGADPSFLWNGGSGYRTSSIDNAAVYVVNRHFSWTTASWTTVDPIWPSEGAFTYVNGNPSTAVDPTGLLKWPTDCCAEPAGVGFEIIDQKSDIFYDKSLGIGVGQTNFHVRLTVNVRKSSLSETDSGCGTQWWEKSNILTEVKKNFGGQADEWFDVDRIPKSQLPPNTDPPFSDLSSKEMSALPCSKQPKQVSSTQQYGAFVSNSWHLVDVKWGLQPH